VRPQPRQSVKEIEKVTYSVFVSREELPKFENKSHFKMKWKFGAARPHPKKGKKKLTK